MVSGRSLSCRKRQHRVALNSNSTHYRVCVRAPPIPPPFRWDGWGHALEVLSGSFQSDPCVASSISPSFLASFPVLHHFLANHHRGPAGFHLLHRLRGTWPLSLPSLATPLMGLRRPRSPSTRPARQSADRKALNLASSSFHC